MYDEFLDWAEAQGLEFPCTATEFAARAVAFIKSTGRPVDENLSLLLRQGGVNEESE